MVGRTESRRSGARRWLGMAALVGAVAGPVAIGAGGTAGADGTTVTVASCSISDLESALFTAESDVTATVDLATGCTGSDAYTVTESESFGSNGPDAFPAVGDGVSLTIEGMGDTITTGSGGDDPVNTRFFEVDSGGSLALDDLILTNGDDADGYGGGAVWNAGTLSADGVTFSNDTTGGDGGAIDNGDDLAEGDATPTVTVTGSTFENDTATGFDNKNSGVEATGSIGNGGAIDNGDNDGSGTVTVTGSTFEDDTVTASQIGLEAAADTPTSESLYADGGAIDNADDYGTGTVTVTGSTFKDDSGVGSVATDGGAIDDGDDDGVGTLTVTGSTFTDNQTSAGSGAGGAIAVGLNFGSGTASVTGSTFDDNGADSGGGAIADGDYDGSGTVSVATSTFTDNWSSDPDGSGDGTLDTTDGGAIDAGDYGGSGDLTLTASTFVGNSAGGDGGAISLGDDGGSASLTATVSTFDANKAAFDGGAIADDQEQAEGGPLADGRPAAGIQAGTRHVATHAAPDDDGVLDSDVVAATFDDNTAGEAGNTYAQQAQGDMEFAADLLADPHAAPTDADVEPAGTVCALSNEQSFYPPVDGGYNLVSDSSCGLTTTASKVVSSLASDIEALADNGGPTETMALVLTSDPAVGAIPNGTPDPVEITGYPDLCPRTDQTGYTSASGVACAVGAWEPRTTPPPPPGTGVTVAPSTLTVDLTVAPSSVPLGSETTAVFTVTVTGSAGTPTGTVDVASEGISLCQVTLVDGTGTCSTTNGSALPVGPHLVVAFYGGNSTYGLAESAPVTLTVTAAPSVAAAGSSPCSAQGYRVVANQGEVYAYGDATYDGELNGGPGALGITPNKPIVGITPTPDCEGYWLAGADGGVFAFGNAPFDDSLPAGQGGLGIIPVAPITGIVATADGGGYWLVGADGGVFAFGDAAFDESLPAGPGGLGITPLAPIVGIAGTPNRLGYWLVGEDGSVYALGDAVYYGGPNTLNGGAGPGSPVTGIVATPDGGGYWVVDQAGAVFAYGDAVYQGGANTLNGGAGPGSPVVGIMATPDGGGYWEVDQAGGVLAYGDAQYLGGPNTANDGAGPGAPVTGISH